MEMSRSEFIEKMKEMGIGSFDRQKCLETFDEGWPEDAMEQAECYCRKKIADLKGAGVACRLLFGI